jgi:hypothetical protein
VLKKAMVLSQVLGKMVLMSKEYHRHGVIDLRKRRVGAALEKTRNLRLELPAHRRSSLRTRRRKLKAFLAFVVLVAAAGFVYGLGAVTYLPKYSINRILVTGAENISPRLVQAFIESKLNDGEYHLLSRENIFLYPKSDITKGISVYFPRILEVKISRKALMAQAVNVIVIERQPFALWCEGINNKQNTTETKCFEMDNGGFIFASAATSTYGRTVFTGGLATSSPPIGQTFLPQEFAGVLAFVSRLKEVGLVATGVSVENEKDFAVSLTSGFVVKASFGADAGTLVRNLKDVLSSDALRDKKDTIEYVDLRFGNRVYYKNKS